ncbi:MAG: hypothetical protein HY870_17060 [Chloroflexi bacterium]|nr:hypothetical protein [Chloroflexota bacterium]
MTYWRFPQRMRLTRSWLLAVSLLGGLILGVQGWGSISITKPGGQTGAMGSALLSWLEPAEPQFTDTDDAALQQQELIAYVEASQQPVRVVQVDLAQHPKISQFNDIDSSASGYGKNACGLVAAAAALGGQEWIALVDRIAQAAGQDYGRNTGIQPSRYTVALQTAFGADGVKAHAYSTLVAVYRELAAGQVVIVDIKVNAYSRTPSVRRPNYAHFARVLGVDLDRQEIYVENTLAGGAYWIVSLNDFVAVWLRPETTASLAPRQAEEVTRWLVSVKPQTSS